MVRRDARLRGELAADERRGHFRRQEVEQRGAGHVERGPQGLRRFRPVALVAQPGSRREPLRFDHRHPARVRRRVRVQLPAVSQLRHERLVPDDLVGREVLDRHPAPVGLDRGRRLLGPRAAVHVVGPPLRHRAQRRGQRGLPQHVPLDVRRAVLLQEGRLRLGKPGEVRGPPLPVALHLLRDPKALFGDVDRRLEDLRPREPSEPLVRGPDALHEPADERSPPAHLGTVHPAGRGEVDPAGDVRRIVLAEHRVPLGVHRVDAIRARVVVHERHDAEVADRRSGGERDLHERRRHRRVDRVPSLLQRLQSGTRREPVVGDGDRSVLPRRDTGFRPVDELRLHEPLVVGGPPLRREIRLRLARRQDEDGREAREEATARGPASGAARGRAH